MKIAFLYGGQGSQRENMGRELYEEYGLIREFYDSIELDFPLKEISFEGGKELVDRTEYTQPLMVAFQIAVTKILEEAGLVPDLTAGLSLGEFTCLYTAGVLTEEDLLGLVRYRGLRMQRVSEKIESSMIAVFTDDASYLEDLCLSVSSGENLVQVTNINTRSQIVLSGEREKIGEVKEILDGESIRYIELNTGGPFHTSYMDPVAEDLYAYMAKLEFKEPKIDIIHNLYGEKREDEDIRRTLSDQVASKVLFKRTLENIIGEDFDLIVEIGYGDVIKGFMRRLDRKTRVHSVNSIESIGDLLEEVGRTDG